MIITPSYSFTRPTGTTQYTAGDLIANSTTAASVVPMKFSLQRVSGTGLIRGIRLYKSTATATAAIFNVHLFTADPGTPTNGDNGAFGIASAVDYLAEVAIDMSTTGSPGTADLFKRSAVLNIGVDFAAPDGAIWGLLEAGTSGTYTPADSEIFKVVLEIERTT